MNAACVVVLCTAPERGEGDRLGAHELARALVEARLCACVNVVPGLRSWFRWQGAVDAADELLLVAKTTAAALPALQARIAALHPYELPEVIALPIAGGLPGYLDWLRDNVQPAEP